MSLGMYGSIQVGHMSLGMYGSILGRSYVTVAERPNMDSNATCTVSDNHV